MHESNVKSLKAAYRHPFEYISPMLYRKDSNRDFERKITTANLYVENEDDFNS